MLLAKIYSHGSLFSSDPDYQRPTFRLYYVHQGSTQTTPHIENAIEEFNRYALTCNLCAKVDTLIVNAEQIDKLYRESKSKISKSITVEKHLTLQEIEGINQGYLCLIPFREFRKLIEDENDDSIMRNVFEDNVRDFQGQNSVNKAIENSLKNGEHKLFTALNNGITIIAHHMNFIGDRLTITDYQIVNGCQTCHILYNNRHLDRIDDVVLTVKVISSDNKVLRDKIIVANNSQTEIKGEQLISLLDSQRKIESHYIAENRFEKLYYERRSKQYHYGTPNILADQIVTIPGQIIAFVSMVLGKPHLTSHYYGAILRIIENEEGGTKIFDSSTHPAYYYMCALAAYKREQYLSTNQLPATLRNVKHHLLFALRLVITPRAIPQLNSNQSQDYCDEVCKALCDNERSLAAFCNAGTVIIDTLGREPIPNDLNDPTLAVRIKETWHRSQFKNRKDKEMSTKQSHTEPFPIYIEPLKEPKVIGKIDLSQINDPRKKRRRLQ